MSSRSNLILSRPSHFFPYRYPTSPYALFTMKMFIRRENPKIVTIEENWWNWKIQKALYLVIEQICTLVSLHKFCPRSLPSCFHQHYFNVSKSEHNAHGKGREMKGKSMFMCTKGWVKKIFFLGLYRTPAIGRTRWRCFARDVTRLEGPFVRRTRWFENLFCGMWSLPMWDGILLFSRLNGQEGKASNTEVVTMTLRVG